MRGAARGKPVALPPRPALPPVLACALSLWASCAAVLAASGSWDAGACLAVGAAGIVASVACAFALWRLPVPIAWAALLGAALGIALGRRVRGRAARGAAARRRPFGTLAIRSRSRRFAGPLWRNVLRAREPSRHRSRYGAA